jgi:peptidoglycan-N-acetylglucosamine deacetylase
MRGSPDVAFTVDLEPDCLPFLDGWRGVDEGMPALLDTLAELEVAATVFATAQVARRSPALIERLVREGHELGSHSVTHPRFDRISREAAWAEINESAEVLREFAPVRSFRAPYLTFPGEMLPMLVDAGYELDSSAARYKMRNDATLSSRRHGGGWLIRVPASITSSALRLPAPVRDPLIRALASPIVLFVHPWEFVDLRNEKLRWDCRAGTGAGALRSLRDVLSRLRSRGARFHRIAELPEVVALRSHNVARGMSGGLSLEATS